LDRIYLFADYETNNEPCWSYTDLFGDVVKLLFVENNDSFLSMFLLCFIVLLNIFFYDFYLNSFYNASSSWYTFNRLSDPAKSIMFKKLYYGFPSLSIWFILIWNIWWLLDELELKPLFLNTLFFDDINIYFRNSDGLCTFIQVCPKHSTLLLTVFISTYF
jgi:hypothetical protein